MKVFHLMSSQGTQIHAGRYRMSAHYENDGGPLIVASARDRPKFYPEACWAPPESIWIGTADSAPIEVEVVDRPSSERTVRLPTRIEMCCSNLEKLEFIVREDSSSARTQVIQVRSGYHVGWRSWGAVYVDDVEGIPDSAKPPEDPEILDESDVRYASARAMGRGTGGGLNLPGGSRPVSLALVADLLERGTKVRLRIKEVVFETSLPSRSHWSPEFGDYRVLAEQIVEATWTKGSTCSDAR
jgi:hypothetical protein